MIALGPGRQLKFTERLDQEIEIELATVNMKRRNLAVDLAPPPRPKSSKNDAAASATWLACRDASRSQRSARFGLTRNLTPQPERRLVLTSGGQMIGGLGRDAVICAGN